MNNLTYSVIIPHKNIPNLLQRCLDSIPQREDLEVIVVDDNSDPKIIDFDNFPGKDRQDTTIIFDKSGKGAGRARNIGLEHAKGKWLLFADADDFYNYCIRDILDEYQNDDSDIVFFNVLGINTHLYIGSKRSNQVNKLHVLYEKKPVESLFHFRYDVGSPWTKLFKKSLVDSHSIRFDETIIHNDTTFSYLAGYYGQKFKVDKRALYCVTYRPDSISYSLDNNKILTRMKVLSNRDRFFLDNDIDISKLEVNLHYDTLIKLKSEKQKDLFNECIKILEDNGFSKKHIRKRMLKSWKQKIIKGLNRRITNFTDKYL